MENLLRIPSIFFDFYLRKYYIIMIDPESTGDEVDPFAQYSCVFP
jgi:hypothetical protein